MRSVVLGLCLIASTGVWAAEPQQTGTDSVFAQVEDVAISMQEYQQALRQTFRDRFYHFNPPDAEKEKVSREVGQKLIDRVLLLKEVERQNVQPDVASVEQEIARYEARYKDSQQWKNTRNQALPGLREHLEQKSRLQLLEKRVRTLSSPEESVLLSYYRDNPDLFTEPEQARLSIIVLKVDPSSPTEKWDGTSAQGAGIIARLRQGESFADLAKAFSQEASAAKGGDMGYLHNGMLPDAVQKVVDKLKPGEFSPEPIRVLEGIVIVRLEDRRESKVRSFEEVKARATELWLRQEAEKTWNAFLVKLRASAQVKVNENAYMFNK